MSYSTRKAADTDYQELVKVSAVGLAAAGASVMTYSSIQGLLASELLVNTMIYGAATAGSAIAALLLLLVFGYLVMDLMAEPKTSNNTTTDEAIQEVA